jgi:hypothetical protein
VSASTIVDVAIGLSFVYVLLSVIASAITEAISGICSLRALTLRHGIERLLKDRTLASKVFDHPHIDGLTKDDHSDPAYIPSDLFARALIDSIVRWDDAQDQAQPPQTMGIFQRLGRVLLGAMGRTMRSVWPSPAPSKAPPKSAESLEELKKRLAEAKNFDEGTRAAITAVLAEDDVRTLDDAREHIAAWFDRSMESVSGWYKRTAHVLICAVAVVIAAVLNVDTFLLVDSLSHDEVLRASVASTIEETMKNPTPEIRTVEGVVEAKKAEAAQPPQPAASDAAPAPKTEELLRKQVVDIKHVVDELTLPVGWPEDGPMFCRPGPDGAPCDRRTLPVTFRGWVRRIGGWIFTAVAISLGAPFWFDLLNKLINLRAASAPPEKVKPRERTAVATSPEPLPTRDNGRSERPSLPRYDQPS